MNWMHHDVFTKELPIEPCRIDLQFLIPLYPQAGCLHKLCEKSDHSCWMKEVKQVLCKQNWKVISKEEIYHFQKPRQNLKCLIIIIIIHNDYTK